MMGNREVIRSTIEFGWLFAQFAAKRPQQPQTPTQALIQTKPNEPILVSAQERLQLREVVASAMEQLTEEEIWIINALLFERLSLREAGAILQIPKTTLARRRDKILRKLRKALENEPLVEDYLNGKT